jgi:hypothetical protein
MFEPPFRELAASVLVAGIVLAPAAARADQQGDQGSCPSDTSAVRAYSFLLNGRSVAHLHGQAHRGDHVVANFTIASPCTGVQVSLATYQAPSGTYDRNTADQQVLYRSDTGTFGAGPGTLAADVPPIGFFQVDFVRGPVIVHFGPPSSNNYYGDQGRLIEADNGPAADPAPVPVGTSGALGISALTGAMLFPATRRRRRGIPTRR